MAPRVSPGQSCKKKRKGLRAQRTRSVHVAPTQFEAATRLANRRFFAYCIVTNRETHADD